MASVTIPRGSEIPEREAETGKTVLYNGYGEWVARLYK